MAAVILAVVVGHGLQLDLVAALTTTRQAERAAGLIAASSIVLALALVIALAWLARTRRFDGADAARALAVGAIAFMALALASPPDPDANAGGGGEGGAVLHDANPNETPAPPVAVDPPAAGTPLPDVYYVILDGYTRGDVLGEVYRFDNEPFLSALEERGFVVARESYSNYPATNSPSRRR